MLVVRVAALLLAASVAWARPDPSAIGRFHVGVTTLTLTDTARGRTLVTEVWYPARVDRREAPIRGGRHPLVLLAHGYCGFRTNFEYLVVPLVSRGFVVAAPDFPGFNKSECDAHGTFGVDVLDAPPLDLSYLRAVFHDRSGPAGRFARRVKGRRAGLIGHSLGGLTSLNASRTDPDLDVVVGLSPVAAARTAELLREVPLRREVLVLAGTRDTAVALGVVQGFFEGLAPPSFLVRVVGGTHNGFTDVDSALTSAELARQQDVTRRYATAFLERYLARKRSFGRFLTAADAAAHGPDIELTARPR